MTSSSESSPARQVAKTQLVHAHHRARRPDLYHEFEHWLYSGSDR